MGKGKFVSSKLIKFINFEDVCKQALIMNVIKFHLCSEHKMIVIIVSNTTSVSVDYSYSYSLESNVK